MAIYDVRLTIKRVKRPVGNPSGATIFFHGPRNIQDQNFKMY